MSDIWSLCQAKGLQILPRGDQRTYKPRRGSSRHLQDMSTRWAVAVKVLDTRSRNPATPQSNLPALRYAR